MKTEHLKMFRREEEKQAETVRTEETHTADSADRVTGEELESLIQTQWAGRNIVYYSETDSTNIRIKQLGEEGAPHGTLAVAERQTEGRGRRGRSWNSPAGNSIYMSILLRPDLSPVKAPMLTLVMALSTAEGLMDCAEISEPLPVLIKWPNDIVIRGRKLAGILTEMNVRADGIHYVVIGVGINVNMEKFPEEIRGTATSLRIECGHEVKRAPVIAAVMKRLEKNYDSFLRAGDLSGLMERYNRLLVNRGREVCILGEKEQYRAYALGINSSGELLVQRQDGTREAVFAGEVSVRGVYGYV